ncbi:hypothetical protein SNEBB_003169 [Seison nebaliae]|nr:hypothetical protein SNEBB_003169 [Seison nebaliae]
MVIKVVEDENEGIGKVNWGKKQSDYYGSNEQGQWKRAKKKQKKKKNFEADLDDELLEEEEAITIQQNEYIRYDNGKERLLSSSSSNHFILGQLRKIKEENMEEMNDETIVMNDEMRLLLRELKNELDDLEKKNVENDFLQVLRYVYSMKLCLFLLISSSSSDSDNNDNDNKNEKEIISLEKKIHPILKDIFLLKKLLKKFENCDNVSMDRLRQKELFEQIHLHLKEEKEIKEEKISDDDDDDGEDNDDDKRKVSYRIEKNKSLDELRRKKFKNNPRVKHRRKYSKALISLRGQKRQFDQKRSMEKYSGEKTGIRSGIIRSKKLL